MNAQLFRYGLTTIAGVILFAGVLSGKEAASSKTVTVAAEKPLPQEERFVLCSVVRTEGKWLASVEDRKTGHRFAWLEKNQVISGHFLKDISEKAVVLVEQETGKATMLHLRLATVAKSSNGAVPVLERSGASETGGLTKASSLMAKVQSDLAGNLLVPRLAPPHEKVSTNADATPAGTGRAALDIGTVAGGSDVGDPDRTKAK